MASDRAIIPVLIDGRVQAELSNVTVNGESGAQEVKTILQGLVGFTKGSPTLELQGTWSIPLAGLEFDVLTAAATNSKHEIQIPVGPKSLVSEGQFLSFSITQSTDANAEVQATFKGKLNKPQ